MLSSNSLDVVGYVKSFRCCWTGAVIMELFRCYSEVIMELFPCCWIGGEILQMLLNWSGSSGNVIMNFSQASSRVVPAGVSDACDQWLRYLQVLYG